MSRRIRVLLIAGITTSVVLGFGVFALYSAARVEPEFYRKSLQVEHKRLERGSDQMLEKTTSLVNALKKNKPWATLLTTDQINGWLAVDLVKNHPRALPTAMHDPRVAISPKQIILACRFEQGGVESVLSLTIVPSVPEPNTVALRIVKARAGVLPVPLGSVIQRISRAAREMQLHLEWRRAGGDPVAVLTFPSQNDKHPVCIETLRLGDGEIYVSGSVPSKAS